MKASHASLLVLLAALSALSCDGPRTHQVGRDYVILPAGEVHEGWFFAAGRQVSIHGTVNGDTYVAGGVVDVDGTINGMLVVAGGQVNVSGAVNDRILAAGGTVRLTGKTTKSITAAGGTVTVGRESAVGENLLLAGNMVQMNGTVEREARVAGREVELAGSVKGNLDVASRRFDAFKGALVGGNLAVSTYDSAGVSVDPGTVHGRMTITIEKHEPETRILGMSGGAFWFQIVFGLTLFVTALALSFLLPRYLASAGTQTINRPAECLLWGLIVLFATPILAFLFFITVIGLPLAAFLFFFYLWLLYASQLVIGAAIGSRLYGLTGKSGWKLFGPVALGLLIVQVLVLFPVIRLIVILAGLIVGVGALALVTKAEYRSHAEGAAGK